MPTHALSVDTNFMWAQNIFLQVIPYEAVKADLDIRKTGYKHDSE